MRQVIHAYDLLRQQPLRRIFNQEQPLQAGFRKVGFQFGIELCIVNWYLFRWWLGHLRHAQVHLVVEVGHGCLNGAAEGGPNGSPSAALFNRPSHVGLRSSILQSGARTLLSSLWKVPDRETMDLMRAFYGRIMEGKRKGAALREAMLEVRDRRLKACGDANPFYWGAFLLIGDSGAI